MLLFSAFCRPGTARKAGVRAAAALVLACCLCAAEPASASQDCVVDAQGVTQCQAGLSVAAAEKIQITQEKSRWCWAAAIAMVFASHGYAVPQQDIVERWLGALVDRTIRAGDFPDLINRHWYSTDGRKLSAQSGRAEAVMAAGAAGAAGLIASLTGGEPLILVSRGHAFVLVGVRWERMEAGDLRFTGATVIDPAPGKGIQPFPVEDLRTALLAQVRVGHGPAADFTSTRQLGFARPTTRDAGPEVGSPGRP